MKILQKIKEACKKAGVPEKYAGKIQKMFNVEAEENIEGCVSLFKDNILSDIEEAEKQSENSAKKAVEEYEKKYGLKEGKVVEEEKKKEEEIKGLSPELAEFIKAQNKQMEELKKTVLGLADNVSKNQKQASAMAIFKESKLPEKWIARIDINSEKSVEDQIKELQDEYAELKQAIVDEQVGEGGYKPSIQPKEKTEAEWREFMAGGSKESKDPSVVDLGL